MYPDVRCSDHSVELPQQRPPFGTLTTVEERTTKRN